MQFTHRSPVSRRSGSSFGQKKDQAMRHVKMMMAILMVAAAFMACKKNETPVSKTTFAGTWQGNWGSGSQDPSNFIKFNFKADGTMTRLDEQGLVIATGTWTLNGINFECTYTHNDGQVHKIAGLYTDFDGVIMSTWGWAPSKANGGTVELKKQ
jgi:hypothetical protein